MSKQIAAMSLLVCVIIALSACTPGDGSLPDDLYTKNIYPGNSGYRLGSSTYQWYAGYYSKIYLNNIDLDDLLPNKGARIYNDSIQSIANASFVPLHFNSELWDNDNIHDQVTNNSRMIANHAGKYIIVASATWAPDAAGDTRSLFIRLNGSTYIASISNRVASTAANIDQNVTTIYDLAIGDYVEAVVWHNAGHNLNIYIGTYSSHFMMQKTGN